MPSQATLDAPETPPSDIAALLSGDAIDGSPGTTGITAITFPHHETLLETALAAGTAAASWHTNSQVLQRRRWHRITFTDPFLVCPYDSELDRAMGPFSVVTGRDISLGGVSFSHTQPLSCRRIVCVFLDEGRVLSAVLVKLNWCRFTKQGVYLSGGQFLRTVRMDMDGELDPSLYPAG